MQDGTDASSASKGIRGIMQRALQQARAEAAATEAQGIAGAAPQHGEGAATSPDPQPVGFQDPEPASEGKRSKRALTSALKRAAQKMQQEEAEADSPAQDALQASEEDQAAPGLPSPGGGAAHSDLLDPADVVLESPSSDTSRTSHTEWQLPPDHLLDKSPSTGSSLGEKLGTILRNALSIPRQSGYAPINEDDDAEPPAHKAPPSRGLSLGERLGSVLQSALSIPRQSAYAPVSQEDAEFVDGDALDPAGDAPGPHRALPRDASYLPEWLNRTLRKGSSMLGRPSFTARSFSVRSSGSSADFSRGSDVSRAGSTLPEWVDAAALQPSGQPEAAPEGAGQLPPAPQHSAQQQASRHELFTKALKPVTIPAPSLHPPAPLITAPSWPPTDSQSSDAPTKESRGKRLLSFWEQQQQAAASAVNQASANAAHPRSRVLVDPSLQRGGLRQGSSGKTPEGMPWPLLQLLSALKWSTCT